MQSCIPHAWNDGNWMQATAITAPNRFKGQLRGCLEVAICTVVIASPQLLAKANQVAVLVAVADQQSSTITSRGNSSSSSSSSGSGNGREWQWQ